MLSPESRKYFCNAIAMSGSALHDWAMTTVESHVDVAFEITAHWGRPQADMAGLVELLKALPAEQFADFNPTEWTQENILNLPIGPTIESRLNNYFGNALGFGRVIRCFLLRKLLMGEEAIRPFIVQPPADIYQTPAIDVDVMFGVTSGEALMFLSPHHIGPDIPANFHFRIPFRGSSTSADTEVG